MEDTDLLGWLNEFQSIPSKWQDVDDIDAEINKIRGD